MPPTNLERQIRSQPDQLARIAGQTVMDAADRLRACRRVWLVGTGTSQHAAELGAAMVSQAGIDARWMASMPFVRFGPSLHSDDGVVVISHNAGAETTYAAAARRRALQAALPLVSITRRGAGLPEAVETVDKETSQTYTVSYTTALLVLAKLAAELGAQELAASIPRVAEASAGAIADSAGSEMEPPARLLVIAGAGPAAVTAREGALKIREASRFPAEGYDIEYLLHGSAVPLSRDDHLVWISPPDADGLVSAVARAASAEGIGVSMIAEPSELPPLLAQIPLTIRLQLLALRFVERRGQDPDTVIVGAWDDEGLWAIGAPSA